MKFEMQTLRNLLASLPTILYEDASKVPVSERMNTFSSNAMYHGLGSPLPTITCLGSHAATLGAHGIFLLKRRKDFHFS